MATVPHVTSGSGLRKFLADGFLLDWVYKGPDCENKDGSWNIGLFLCNITIEMQTFQIKALIQFLTSSTCFEPHGFIVNIEHTLPPARMLT